MTIWANDENNQAKYWWYSYPTFAGDCKPELVFKIKARWAESLFAGDPTWYYTQYITVLDGSERCREIKDAGVRLFSYIEGYGQCMLYAIDFKRKTDGSFLCYENHPGVAKALRNAWSWEFENIKMGNAIRWVGPHNTVNDEDFIQPLFTKEKLGLAVPKYPDGRDAVGWTSQEQYPLNARIYDACCSKDINGNLAFEVFMIPEKANKKPAGNADRLYRIVIDQNYQSILPGHTEYKNGDIVYVSGLSISKDIASPFWLDYIRLSMQEILKQNIDSVWCDNFSNWDNFNARPIINAFGDWSISLFNQFLKDRLTESEIQKLGIDNVDLFDVRGYLKKKATEFGAKDSSNHFDPAWTDVRWQDEPVWNAYKVFKQYIGQKNLRKFYDIVHEEANKAGREDFCLAGNDMPGSFGWAHDDYLDMVSSENAPGWGLFAGSRGMMIPPLGKMAVVYRTLLEHQKGPYATVWYYLNSPYDKYREKPEISKILMAEAFANSTFLKYGGNPSLPGTPESVEWWNDFVISNESKFGKRHIMADVGLLYSPDNQLAVIAPGGNLNFERQAHSFGHWGFATAMIDAHIPYRVITDWNLNSKSLEGLKTFIIPQAECLDDSAFPVLDKWVKEGGELIITGQSGIREGVSGFFKKREISILSSLVGIDISKENQLYINKVGKGKVIWSYAPLDIEYYLKENERSSRLDGLTRIISRPEFFDAMDLSPTVGIFLWKSEDGRTLFADLVNYNLDADKDIIQPAEDLKFMIRLPEGYKNAKIETISPDNENPATLQIRNNWVVVYLDRLIHFAGIKLTIQE